VRALVIGANGFIGGAIVRELSAHGYTVRAADRTQFASQIANGELVVDAAGPAPLGLVADEEATYARMRELIDGVERRGATLVFVSSFTTLVQSEHFGARWRRAVYPYFRVKETMERMVLDAGRSVVLNPSACLGPDNPTSEKSFVHLVLEQRLPAVIDRTINVIDVRDVAIAARLAARRETAGRIPLAGHNVNVHELARRIARLGGVAPPAFAVNAALAQAAAFWSETAFALMGRVPPSAIRATPLVADGVPMNISDEQRALGAFPRPLDATLRDAVRSHRFARGLERGLS